MAMIDVYAAEYPELIRRPRQGAPERMTKARGQSNP
jgi:hypothetical protein